MDGSEQQIAAKKRRGKPFVPGDPRINRHGVPNEAVALARALREAAADVLLGPSPRHRDKTRLECILETLADRAERGDGKAAEILFDRFGGRPTQPEADGSGGGSVVIQYDGPRPDWMLPPLPNSSHASDVRELSTGSQSVSALQDE